MDSKYYRFRRRVFVIDACQVRAKSRGLTVLTPVGGRTKIHCGYLECHRVRGHGGVRWVATTYGI